IYFWHAFCFLLSFASSLKEGVTHRNVQQFRPIDALHRGPVTPCGVWSSYIQPSAVLRYFLSPLLHPDSSHPLPHEPSPLVIAIPLPERVQASLWPNWPAT